MSKQVEAKVYWAADGLRETISLFDYVEKHTDDKIKEAVKPVMNDAKKLAASAVRSGIRSPHSKYSWKLLKKNTTNTYVRKNGRYARSLTVRDHSKPTDVFYEVTGAKREYTLSHLLEHSHKVHPWGNKKVTVMTRAVPHMSVAQDLVDTKATKACEKVIDKLFG